MHCQTREKDARCYKPIRLTVSTDSGGEGRRRAREKKSMKHCFKLNQTVLCHLLLTRQRRAVPTKWREACKCTVKFLLFVRSFFFRIRNRTCPSRFTKPGIHGVGYDTKCNCEHSNRELRKKSRFVERIYAVSKPKNCTSEKKGRKETVGAYFCKYRLW